MVPNTNRCHMCTWVGFRPSYMKCWSNNLFSTVLSWFDLVMTLRWPHQDLGITPLWNPRPTHVTMCTWLKFRPGYMTPSYTTLRVKGTILWWPLVTLSMHRKSADCLKVTWYIVRLKNMVYKNTRGGGGGVIISTFSPWSIWSLLYYYVCAFFIRKQGRLHKLPLAWHKAHDFG